MWEGEVNKPEIHAVLGLLVPGANGKMTWGTWWIGLLNNLTHLPNFAAAADWLIKKAIFMMLVRLGHV